MAAEGSSRAPLAVLSVLLVVAVGLGVRAGGAGDAARWERLPAPAAPLSEAVPPRWPPAAPVEAQILGVFGEPGPVLPTPEALWVPTGFGLRRIPLDGGRDLEIATPGLARRVIRIGDDSLWVADGHGGVAAFRWTDNDLAPLPGLHPGKVFDLVSCGDSALASVTEGLLLRLAVDDAGSPREVARLVVDGRPTDLSVVPVDGGCRWALALKGGGLVTGRAGSGGGLALEKTHRPPSYVMAVGLDDGEVIWTRPVGGVRAFPARDGLGAIRGTVRQVVRATDGEFWLAAGESGLYRGLPEAEVAVDPIRRRDGLKLTGLAPDPDSTGVYASWFDGLVERLDAAGEPVESWHAGSSGRLERVSLGHSGVRVGAGFLIESRADSTSLALDGDIGDLVETPAGLLIGAGDEGIVRWPYRQGAERPLPEPLGAGRYLGVARAQDGSLWAADGRTGLVRYDPEGVREGPWESPAVGAQRGVVAVALGPTHAIAGGWMYGGLVAVPLEGESQPLTGYLPGRATDALAVGSAVVFGLHGGALVSVTVTEGELTVVDLLRLPMARLDRVRSVRLCEASGGLLATLGESGVARVDVAPDGGLQLRGLVDTPGAAADCVALPEPDSFEVADTTARLHLVWP